MMKKILPKHTAILQCFTKTVDI